MLLLKICVPDAPIFHKMIEHNEFISSCGSKVERKFSLLETKEKKRKITL